MVLLWFLSSYPAPPAGATGPAIQYSIAGRIGQALQHVFAPIGFNWQISIALVPGLAAREVAVGALGTVYSLSAAGDAVAETLEPIIARGWSLATAYSLLAWYVFAPQCLSTLAVTKRETNSWRWPLLMAGLPVRAGLRGGLRHLPPHAVAGGRLMAQTLLIALIVACSAAYVLWALLLPAAARRRIASALLRWPWPGRGPAPAGAGQGTVRLRLRRLRATGPRQRRAAAGALGPARASAETGRRRAQARLARASACRG